MPVTDKGSPQHQPPSIGPAEALYVLFRSLSKNEKLAVAKYILEDEEVRKTVAATHIPNEATLRAFKEDKSEMPHFDSLEALRKDLLS
jgi:hypothetical protein